MKHILRQLPFLDVPSAVEVAGEAIPIRAGQIVAWASLSTGQALNKDAPRFPVVLDTGHTHNLSLREYHLLRWSGLRIEELQPLGRILANRQEVRLYAANLWIYRNRPGTAELLPRPHRVALLEGIAIHPGQDPRLPLLGTKALMTNRLRLTLFGKNRTTSLVQE